MRYILLMKKVKNRLEIPIISMIVLGIGMVLLRRQLFQGYLLTSIKWNSDLVRANLPTYIMMYDFLFSGTEGLWSWRMGAGTSIVSHFDVFFDPFTYVTFLVGRSHIAYMMVWSLLLKLVCSGVSISIYIREFTKDIYAITVASVMYAFTGYALIMGNNLALGTILVYAPLALLGIERLINGNRKIMLVLSMAAVALLSFYYFYITCVLSGIYLFVRSMMKKSSFIAFVKDAITLCVCALAGMALAGVSVIPQVCILMNNSRLEQGKDAVFSLHMFKPSLGSLCTFFARSIGVNTLGVISEGTYKGMAVNHRIDYFQNEAFISCISPILIAEYYCLTDKKNRIIVLMMSLICMLSVTVPFFSYAMNAFSTINMRWIYIWSIVQCLTVALSISEIRRKRAVNLVVVVLSVLIVLILLYLSIVYINGANLAYVVASVERDYGYFRHIFLIYFFSIIMALILKYYFIKENNMNKNAVKRLRIIVLSGVLLIIVTDAVTNFEVLYADKNNLWAVGDQIHTEYNDDSSKVVSHIRTSDPGVYRIYKEFDSVYDENGIPSDNDSMAQNYFGLKCYNSNNNSSYTEFLQTMGVYLACLPDIYELRASGVTPMDFKGSQLNYINGIDDFYNLLDYMGVRYFLFYEENSSNDSADDEHKKIVVSRLDNTFPITFYNTRYLTKEDLLLLSYKDRQEALFNNTIVEDSDYENDYTTENVRHNASIKQFDYDTLIIEANNIEQTKQLLCTTIPYDKGWKAIVNGVNVNVQRVNIGFVGVNIQPGSNFISLKFVPVGMKAGIVISVSSFVMIAVYCAFCYIFRRKGAMKCQM